MKRKVLPLESAYRLLQPHLPNLVKCIRTGFSEYLQLEQCAQKFGHNIQYKTRTKASLIHEHISAHLDQTFEETPDVIAKEWNGVFGLKVANDLFIRVKKLNSDYSITSFMTKQTKRYLRQLPIPGFPEEPTLLIAGYIPTPGWKDIKDICIACWDGDMLRWIFDVDHHATEQMTLPFNMIQDMRNQ